MAASPIGSAPSTCTSTSSVVGERLQATPTYLGGNQLQVDVRTRHRTRSPYRICLTRGTATLQLCTGRRTDERAPLPLLRIAFRMSMRSSPSPALLSALSRPSRGEHD